MNHLDTSDRKNVNVLGENDLAKVVGGRGRYWGRHGGGYKQSGGYKQGGGKQGASMQQRPFGPVQLNLTVINQLTIVVNNFND